MGGKPSRGRKKQAFESLCFIPILYMYRKCFLVSALFIVSVCYSYTTGFEINKLVIIAWRRLAVVFKEFTFSCIRRKKKLKGYIRMQNAEVKVVEVSVRRRVLFSQALFDTPPKCVTLNVCKSSSTQAKNYRPVSSIRDSAGNR